MLRSLTRMLDPDFVHPAIVVPVVARLQLHKLPPNESRDWTRKALTKAGIIRTIYDPTAGTGGFLSSGMGY